MRISERSMTIRRTRGQVADPPAMEPTLEEIRAILQARQDFQAGRAKVLTLRTEEERDGTWPKRA